MRNWSDSSAELRGQSQPMTSERIMGDSIRVVARQSGRSGRRGTRSPSPAALARARTRCIALAGMAVEPKSTVTAPSGMTAWQRKGSGCGEWRDMLRSRIRRAGVRNY